MQILFAAFFLGENSSNAKLLTQGEERVEGHGGAKWEDMTWLGSRR